MAQSDYYIANAPGAIVRADINENLEAIVTLNSGAGAPADTFPFMFWPDTAEGKIKQRNSSNTAWIEIGDIDVPFWNLLQRLKESGGTTLTVGSILDGYPVVRVGDSLIGAGVRRIRESGGADLSVGSIGEAEFLKRVGSEIKGITSILPDGFSNWCSYFPNVPFGNGSEGNVIISTNTTLPYSGVGIKVMQYNNLTINAGITFDGHLDDKVMVLLVKGTLTVNGLISMNERGGSGGVGVVNISVGLGGGAGAFGAGGGGSSGYDISAGGGGGGGGVPGLNGSYGGNSIATDQWNLGGHSKGKGGNGIAGQDGGPGAGYINSPLTPFIFEIARTLWGGGGGSGGNGSVGGLSGAGGRGGGVIWIEANNIVWGAGGLISANASNGLGGGSAARGGGGGGGGGFIQEIHKTKTGNSNFTVNAGAGGGSGGGTGDKWGGNGASGIYGEFQV